MHAALEACLPAGTGAGVLARGQGAYLEGEVWAGDDVWLSSVGGLHAAPGICQTTLMHDKPMADCSRVHGAATGAAQQHVLRQAGTATAGSELQLQSPSHALRQAGAT